MDVPLIKTFQTDTTAEWAAGTLTNVEAIDNTLKLVTGQVTGSRIASAVALSEIKSLGSSLLSLEYATALRDFVRNYTTTTKINYVFCHEPVNGFHYFGSVDKIERYDSNLGYLNTKTTNPPITNMFIDGNDLYYTRQALYKMSLDLATGTGRTTGNTWCYGLALDKVNRTLFVANDNGQLYEFDLDTFTQLNMVETSLSNLHMAHKSPAGEWLIGHVASSQHRIRRYAAGTLAYLGQSPVLLEGYSQNYTRAIYTTSSGRLFASVKDTLYELDPVTLNIIQTSNYDKVRDLREIHDIKETVEGDLLLVGDEGTGYSAMMIVEQANINNIVWKFKITDTGYRELRQGHVYQEGEHFGQFLAAGSASSTTGYFARILKNKADIFVSLNGGIDWARSLPGKPIPGLTVGQDLSAVEIMTKQELYTPDALYSPVINTQTLTFTNKTRTITIEKNIEIAGTVSGGGLRNIGYTTNLLAEPSYGYGFVEWRKGVTVLSTNASYDHMVIDEDETITAIFVKLIIVDITVIGGTSNPVGPIMEVPNTIVPITVTAGEGVTTYRYTFNYADITWTFINGGTHEIVAAKDLLQHDFVVPAEDGTLYIVFASEDTFDSVTSKKYVDSKIV